MLEVLKLMTLGMKSELVDATQAIALQDIIIEQGREKLDNKKIARLVLIATIRQAVFKGIVSEKQRMLINEIYIRYTQDKSILETYYYQVLRLISEEIEYNTGIEKVINEVKNHELSKELLLYAYFVKYQKEESEEIKIEIAREGIDGVEIDSIKQCRVCLSYSEMLSYIIEKKARSEQHIETKYINLALELCEREERCKLVCSSVIWALTAYVFTIKSEYEKKGISEKLINVCEKCESWEEWAWICEEYVNTLEDSEREEFISKKKEYQTYLVATNDMSLGIEAYTQHDIEKCKMHLLNAYKKYETLFGEEYNPAAINIAFLVRRNEMPEIKEEVLEILNKIKWMNGVAVYHINKALAFVEQEAWEKAVNEIEKIDSSVEEALEWWLEEGRVDEKEKCEVILLLVFGNILSFSDLEEHEIIACKQYMEKEYVPDNIKRYFEKMSAEEIE